tara:strand:+ start:1251 stop:3068 length:1818 start_codon:yes stop_codon:yes gene_type:complete
MEMFCVEKYLPPGPIDTALVPFLADTGAGDEEGLEEKEVPRKDALLEVPSPRVVVKEDPPEAPDPPARPKKDTPAPKPPAMKTVQQITPKPRPDKMITATWISSVLVERRGVLSALPTGGDGAKMEMDRSIAAGRSWWWMWKLRLTAFEHKDCYRTDGNTSVYRTMNSDAFDWMPNETAYAQQKQQVQFEGLSLLGISVSVREFPLPTLKTTTLEIHEAMETVAPRVAMELDLASLELTPAIFATVLAFDKDKYAAFAPGGRYDAVDFNTSMQEVESEKSEGSRRVVGMITVSQFHSFRLGDMLRAFNNLGAAHNVGYATMNLYDAASLLALKIRKLACNKYLKLNMIPDTVVFVPNMKLDEKTDAWTAMGYTFEDPEKYGREAERPIEGEPMFSEVDPRFTRQLTADADVNCAYALMSLVLLASVRAKYGDAYLPFYRRFMGLDAVGEPTKLMEEGKDGKALPTVITKIRAEGKLDAFCATLRNWNPTFFRTKESFLNDAFDDIARDFRSIVMSSVIVPFTGSDAHASSIDVHKPVFEQFLLYATGSSTIPSALFQPQLSPDRKADREQSREDKERLLTVVKQERERWLRVKARAVLQTQIVAS